MGMRELATEEWQFLGAGFMAAGSCYVHQINLMSQKHIVLKEQDLRENHIERLVGIAIIFSTEAFGSQTLAELRLLHSGLLQTVCAYVQRSPLRYNQECPA